MPSSYVRLDCHSPAKRATSAAAVLMGAPLMTATVIAAARSIGMFFMALLHVPRKWRCQSPTRNVNRAQGPDRIGGGGGTEIDALSRLREILAGGEILQRQGRLHCGVDRVVPRIAYDE